MNTKYSRRGTGIRRALEQSKCKPMFGRGGRVGGGQAKPWIWILALQLTVWSYINCLTFLSLTPFTDKNEDLYLSHEVAGRRKMTWQLWCIHTEPKKGRWGTVTVVAMLLLLLIGLWLRAAEGLATTLLFPKTEGRRRGRGSGSVFEAVFPQLVRPAPASRGNHGARCLKTLPEALPQSGCSCGWGWCCSIHIPAPHSFGF